MPQHMDPAFRRLLLERFSLDELESHPGAVFGLWADSRLAYLNRAWHDFAAENGGHPAIRDSWGLGSRYLDAIPAIIRPVYEHLLASALDSSDALHPVAHDYECSNATMYRTFRMQLYPLGLRSGVLIVNTLTMEIPHDHALRHPEPPDEARYRNTRGLVLQCCYCHRVQDASNPLRWDWVPAWVETHPVGMSHGACPICRDFHLTGTE